jgi:uncharacterized protein YbjT (DUF2867 family)
MIHYDSDRYFRRGHPLLILEEKVMAKPASKSENAMSEDKPVLVIGGTRGTGLLIARLLHRQGVPVRVLARDRTRAVTLFGRTVEAVSGDITKADTLPAAIDGARHIIFTAGCRSGFQIIAGAATHTFGGAYRIRVGGAQV